MARQILPGTPSRSSRYVMPGAAGRLTLWSLAGAAGALVVAVALYLGGAKGVASPGQLASPHAAMETRCAQCHQPAKAVVDLRCERCHDPLDTRRLGTQAHAALSAGPFSAGRVGRMDCAICHDDHAGRAASLTRVDDSRCASCHGFSSFRRHPEFAAVRAGREPDPGIDFSHEVHLKEIAKTGGDRCLSCHQPTADQQGFEPIAFDTHCVKCHVKDRVLTLNGTDALKSGFTPANLLLPSSADLPAPSTGSADERGRVVLERFTHRDRWTLATAARITRTIASPAMAAERARLSADIARLSALAQAVPISSVAEADLDAWSATLQRDLAALDTRIAAGPSGAADSAAAMAAAAAAIDPSLAPLSSDVAAAQPRAADPNQARPADAQQIDDRRREIQQLLDAVSARTTGPLADRAAALRKRLADLKAESAATAAPSAGAVADRLQAADAALAAIEAAAGPTMVEEGRALGDEAGRQMSGGVDAGTQAGQTAKLLALLDGMSARGSTALRARVSELRLALLSLSQDADGLRVRRDQEARLADRLALERTLRADQGPSSVEAAANSERTAAARAVQALQARLAALDVKGATLPDLDPARAKVGLKGLLGACLACHRLNGDDTAMRPVAAGRSLLTAAIFTHKPHVLQTRCESCHASIPGSKAGVDANVPAVASCQACHNASQARADCASCHTYHPRSAAALVVARR